MVIKRLNLKNFGKFHDRVITFEDGMNVIYGENEKGKSTIHTFIQGMLFGIDKPRGKASKEDPYVKYEPWDTPGLYNGSMDLLIEGNVYRLQRNFNRFQKSFTITNLETGREISSELYETLLNGLTESSYKNTISISQLKAKTEKELAEELRNYITNLSLTKTTIDVGRAIALLKAKKKAIESRKLEEEIRDLENKIKENYRIEDKIDELTISKNKIVKDLEGIREALIEIKHHRNKDAEKAYDKLAIMLERYRNYVEDSNKRKELESKLTNIEREIEELEINYINPLPLGQGIEEIKGINKELTQAQKELTISNQKIKEIENKSKKQESFLLIPISMLFLSILLITQKLMVLGGGFVVVTILCSYFYLYLRKKNKSLLKEVLKFDESLRMEENKLQTLRTEVFKKFHVANELELQKKYDRTLLWDTTYELKEKMRRTYVNELKQMEEDSICFRNGFIQYVKTIGFTKDITDFNASVLEDVEEYVRQCKAREEKETIDLQERYESYQQELSRINFTLESYIDNEEELLFYEEKIKDLYKEQKEEELTRKALDLAISSMDRISMDIHDGFGHELNTLVSNLICNITNGKYSKVKIDDKLGIKISHKDELYDISKLSVGTMEQLYLSLRLAVTEIMFKDQSMPIILDDSFAYYDDNRTKHALHTIHKNQSGQVILFTCHKRERELLDEQMIPYHYVSL